MVIGHPLPLTVNFYMNMYLYQHEYFKYFLFSSFIEGHRWNETSSTPWNTSSEVRPEDKQFPCPICNKVFSTRGSLASHKYAYHKDYSPSQQLISPSPLLQPNPMQLLDFQMEPSLEKDKDIECPICHKYFSTKGSLATHKYNYHRNSNSLLQQ